MDSVTHHRRATWWTLWTPLLLLGLTLAIGTWGFHDHLHTLAQTSEDAPRPRLRDAFFHAAGLPLLETADIAEYDSIPPQLDAARFLGLFTLAYASALAVVLLFGEKLKGTRIRAWRWLPAVRRRGHAVVCGLGWRGHQLALDMLDNGWRVVVIANDADTNPVTSRVRDRGAVILAGDALDVQVLARADVRAAARILIPGGSDELNLRVLKQIVSCRTARPGARKACECSVHVQDARLREAVHSSIATDGAEGPDGRSIQPVDTPADGEARFRINCFDPAETTARLLMGRFPIDGPPGADSADVHVLIVGYTAMARALLHHAMLVGHLLDGRRLRVTVLAENADTCRVSFLRTFPCFRPGALGDDAAAGRLQHEVLPNVEFLELPVADSELLDTEKGFLSRIGSDSTASLYICLDEGIGSSTCAATLLPALEQRAQAVDADVQLFYNYDYPGDEHGPLVERNLRALAPGIAVHAFSAFIEGCTLAAVEGRPDDDVARQIASFYQRLFGSPSWDKLPESDRISNRRAADHVATKMRCIGATVVAVGETGEAVTFSTKHIADLAELEHRRWCAERILSGWRPLPRTQANRDLWAERKAALKRCKRHIDLVPFDDLDEQDRGKDHMLIRGIPEFLEAVGRRAVFVPDAMEDDAVIAVAATKE
ncbi:NAD-binding protein [soil metagenome]